MKRFLRSITLCTILVLLLPVTANAEIKTIETDSSYIMGDNDSKIDARRIATQEAKRKALEMSGTFVESLTEVKNMALTKDEIRAYTAGVVETEIISEEMKGTTANPEIYIKARCKIDTDVLMKHINRFRESEEIKEQLASAMKENETLKNERDALVKKLSAERDKSKADDIRKKLNTVLAKEEVNDEVGKVWNSLAYKIYRKDSTESKEGIQASNKELDDASAVLKNAVKVNPKNPRIHMLLAAIYHKKGDIANAEREVREAIEANPSNILFHMKLGLLLRDNGRHAEALKEFKIVQKLKPRYAPVLFHTGMTYKAMDNCGEAFPYLKRFMSIAQRNENLPERMKADAVKAIRECKGEPKGERIQKRPFRNR
jgi:Flp pilus assembly protein TadD